MGKKRGSYLGAHTNFGGADFHWFSRGPDEVGQVNEHVNEAQKRSETENKRLEANRAVASEAKGAQENSRTKNIKITMQVRIAQIMRKDRNEQRDRKIIEVKD